MKGMPRKAKGYMRAAKGTVRCGKRLEALGRQARHWAGRLGTGLHMRTVYVLRTYILVQTESM